MKRIIHWVVNTEYVLKVTSFTPCAIVYHFVVFLRSYLTYSLASKHLERQLYHENKKTLGQTNKETSVVSRKQESDENVSQAKHF